MEQRSGDVDRLLMALNSSAVGGLWAASVNGVLHELITPAYQRHQPPPLGHPYGHGYVRPAHPPPHPLPCLPGHPTMPCPPGAMAGVDDVSWNAMMQLILLSFVSTAGESTVNR